MIILFLVATMGLIFLPACGQAELANGDLNSDAAQSGLRDNVALAATAEAQTTSTALVAYETEINTARSRWERAAIDSYTMVLTYNEGQGSQQFIDVEVVDGEITKFDHDCGPPQICFLITIEQQNFTVPGLFDMLENLAAQRIPLAIIRFNETYGYPEAISTNSDESPIIRTLRIEQFELIE